MNDLAVAREFAAPAAAASPHFDAPRWWPEWIAQVLATAPARAPRATSALATATPRAAHGLMPPPPDALVAAAAVLRDAAQALREAETGTDDDPLALAVARHRLHLARRDWQAQVERAAGPGAHWCLCALEAATPR